MFCLVTMSVIVGSSPMDVRGGWPIEVRDGIRSEPDGH